MIWAGVAGGTGEEEVYELPPFTVTAYWLVEDLARYAGSGRVLSRLEVAESGAGTVAELLETHAGVPLRTFSGNGASAEVDLRGFGENSGLRTLILVDGQPVNRPDMGQHSWLEIPISQVERVEVLRGGQSARYGNHAMGGVINIVTRLGRQVEPTTELETAGGSFGSWLGRFGHLRREGGIDLALALEHQQTAGYRENSGYRAHSGKLNLGGNVGRRMEWRAGVSAVWDEVEFPGPLSTERYLENPRQSVYTAFGQGGEYGSDNRRRAFDGTISWRSEEDLRLTAATAYTERQIKWNMGPGSHADNLLRSGRATLALTQDSTDLGWTAGLVLDRDQLDLRLFQDRARTRVRGQADLLKEAVGVYGQADGRLGEALEWRTGVRVDRHRNQVGAIDLRAPADSLLNFRERSSESGWSADLELGWRIEPRVRAWVRYNRVMRFPVTDEIAAYQGFRLAESFNRELRAERGHNAEAGFLWEKSPWSFRANLFALWMEGEISFDYETNLNRNLSSTRRLGTEVSLTRRGRYWDLAVFHSLIQAEHADGVFAGGFIPLVPRHRISAVSTIRPHEAVAIKTEWVYAGASFEGNDHLNTQARIPSWHVLNFMLQVRLHRHLSVYGRVNNLLDQRYASLKYSGSWYPAPGRSFRLGLRATF